MFYSQEQIDRANSTDLVSFLKNRGEKLIKSGKEYRWAAHDSLTIRGSKWFRHSQSRGGYPVDFVMEFYGTTFTEAMEMLIAEQGDEKKEVFRAPAKEFRLPARNENNRNAVRYLTECRGIDADLVAEFISDGSIYEEAAHHNVVFVGRDPQGLPRYAHCRGTDPDEKFRIDVFGADKSYSFSYEGSGNTLAVFEAPIDLLSFITLYPTNWKENSYLSLGGIGSKALERYLQDHPRNSRIYLCLDNDDAGNDACSRLSESLDRDLSVIRMRPHLKDWNEILTSNLEDKSRAYDISKRSDLPPEPGVEMIRLSDVEQTEVEWLWKPYIPFGKLTILQGNPGEGKTYFAMNLAAACTNRQLLPGIEPIEPFNVIYQTAEDGLGDTVKPRLIEAGADLNRVLTINDADRPVTLSDERIEKAIRENEARLLIIDPIQAYLGAEIDMNRANEVRPVFRALGDVAQRTGCAIILIGHLNKASGMQSTYRGLGSIDFTACVRSLLIIGKKKDDPDVRILAHEKSSLAPNGPSLAFILGDGEGFRWIGECDLTADQMLGAASTEKREDKRQQAKTLILSMLTGGRHVLSCDIDKAAMEKGISSRTVRDAKAELGMKLKSCITTGRQKEYWLEDTE